MSSDEVQESYDKRIYTPIMRKVYGNSIGIFIFSIIHDIQFTCAVMAGAANKYPNDSGWLDAEKEISTE